ncbi:MAG: ATPase [Frankiales bacterium]|nr:ATPase [Frankiales bacterium]
MRRMDVNPFRYSGPVGGRDLIGRDGETEQLQRTAEEGNNSRLVAPRRYGKTSLLRRLTDEVRTDGWEAVYVDFFGVVTLADVAQRIDRAYSRDLSGPVARWYDGLRRTLSGMTVGAGPVSAGVTLAAGTQALQDRLDLPRRVHGKHGRRVLVVFDEFQGVLTAQSDADALIRAEIQHHADVASYVFAGSHVGMMRELFGDRRRAFYAQARELALPPLSDDATAAFLTERFARTGRDVGTALAPLLETCAGHPQRTILLAHALWEQTSQGESADEASFADGLAGTLTELLSEFQGMWSGLPSGQRRVLVQVAENTAGLYAVGTAGRGGSVGTALAALADRGEVMVDASARTGHRVVDPLLALWLREGRPQAWPDR